MFAAFATSWTVICQAPQSMEFFRQECWSGLPFPPPEDLPDTGIELGFLCLLHWQVDSLPLHHLGSPIKWEPGCVWYCWNSFTSHWAILTLTQIERLGFDSWVGKILWRRKWQPTPVFFPGKSHGQRSLEFYRLWGLIVGQDWATEHTHALSSWKNRWFSQVCGVVSQVFLPLTS